ncbi:hypothetical protein HELRODRAFT_175904 [Helobdella robusta]|uniref:Uncharacterized protein n=1 Tax=Helobdella robusta TaxID=6412 RepID=T1F9V0_HELRO|nr:hypothetical protein HELRODRAFT_175904 [Helobdella robusta]ESO00465.1 hypothetical protein HELRODRAFT_175904 [Helobdella robusta]
MQCLNDIDIDDFATHFQQIIYSYFAKNYGLVQTTDKNAVVSSSNKHYCTAVVSSNKQHYCNADVNSSKQHYFTAVVSSNKQHCYSNDSPRTKTPRNSSTRGISHRAADDNSILQQWRYTCINVKPQRHQHRSGNSDRHRQQPFFSHPSSRSSLPNIKNINEFTVHFQALIYKYLASTYDNQNLKTTLPIKQDKSIKTIKKRLKSLTMLGRNTWQFDEQISELRKLIRKKLALQVTTKT